MADLCWKTELGEITFHVSLTQCERKYIAFASKILQILTKSIILTNCNLYCSRKHFIIMDYRSSSSSSFEGYPLQVRHKQDWRRGFILLLPQTAELPGSDAGSDIIKPASSFVIQNRQTSYSMWCPMYRARC